ncbi:pyridoxal-phosphate dependent enzyme [Nocardia goodfellowii]
MSISPPQRNSHTDALSLDRAYQAREVIPREFLDTPQFEDQLLNSALGGRVIVKVESLNPLRSFKGRGVSFALRDLSPGEIVVCSSSGNFGQAVAYVGAIRNASVRIFVPSGVNPVKRERMCGFGAHVIDVDGGLQDARRAAHEEAIATGARLVVDGIDPGIAEGAATIAEELGHAGAFDALIAPIGDGSLISGIALWARHHWPSTRIIGVNAAAARAVHDSWRTGQPVTIEPTSTFAEGITIPRPHRESLERIHHAVDDIVLVSDEDIRAGMRLIETHLSLMVEPAGAAAIAAVLTGRAKGDRVATILTGSNRHPSLHSSAKDGRSEAR